MFVGVDGADATLDNALSMCTLFSLKRDDAVREIAAVALAVSGWKAHFRQCGVTARDIELLVEQIDRAFLRTQREAFLPRT